MRIKANLHFHAAEDPQDRIGYSFLEGLGRAAELGFGALALTCHNALVDQASFREAAAEKGVLFIPGTERTIEGAHVVILNPDKDIASVSSFADLSAYRASHPGIFILAPHPYFPVFSLGRKLETHISLFDAIEHTWFYSRILNPNRKAARIARRYRLPLISTSDTHELHTLPHDYAVIDAEEKTIPAIFEAIRKGRFENHTAPKRLLGDMVSYLIERERGGGAKRAPHGR